MRSSVPVLLSPGGQPVEPVCLAGLAACLRQPPGGVSRLDMACFCCLAEPAQRLVRVPFLHQHAQGEGALGGPGLGAQLVEVFRFAGRPACLRQPPGRVSRLRVACFCCLAEPAQRLVRLAFLQQHAQGEGALGGPGLGAQLVEVFRFAGRPACLRQPPGRVSRLRVPGFRRVAVVLLGLRRAFEPFKHERVVVRGQRAVHLFCVLHRDRKGLNRDVVAALLERCDPYPKCLFPVPD